MNTNTKTNIALQVIKFDCNSPEEFISKANRIVIMSNDYKSIGAVSDKETNLIESCYNNYIKTYGNKILTLLKEDSETKVRIHFECISNLDTKSSIIKNLSIYVIKGQFTVKATEFDRPLTLREKINISINSIVLCPNEDISKYLYNVANSNYFDSHKPRIYKYFNKNKISLNNPNVRLFLNK